MDSTNNQFYHTLHTALFIMVDPEYIPHDREVVSAAISLWKENPATESLGNVKLHALVKQRNPTWSLSANRLKTLLKSHGIQTNVPLVQYVSETVSQLIPDLELPSGVKILMTKARGKALYSTRAIKKGEEIWYEEPLILVAPLDHIALMRKSLACAFCARPFQTRTRGSTLPIGGSDCQNCNAKWCNPRCRKSDIIHSALWHSTGHSKLKQVEWIKYEQFCLDNQWIAAYAYGVVLLSILRDPTNNLKSQMDSMAKVSQDVRQKAVDSQISSFDLAAEQLEQMWNQGYNLLKEVVVEALDEFTYEDYLYGLGMVNINNLDGCLYLTQSHLNHSCDPNVDVKIIGRTTGIKVYAKRDIRAGEELLTTYVNPNDDLHKRKYELRVNWGFLCACPRCKQEEKEQQETNQALLKESERENGGSTLTVPLTTERVRRKSVRFEEAVEVV